ncbi:flagellar hook-length control protein FliK [Massilia sp. YIM B02763]|uniref:flagellar hook-length control protein FliK n=1 Tax=Massilia sp. YIM B02763 TaxID=3050130 RepID=UPI0025B640DA|nr:flagellar hook-length control protein FliK [Massilia sp. YIM B02763]MDN4052658.1 flagellar hook-length control protein FliK [Massilia sp. YIM B02763]
MLSRDQLSIPQVARTAPVAAAQGVADPRQQDFQRALSVMLGQSMQAEVLSKLPDGSFMVRVADMAARMPLPNGAQPGTQVPLTLVAINPRPTFQVQTAQGTPAFAEAAAADAQGAAANAPLAYLEGKAAAAMTRTAALLASAQTLARVPGGAADGANASISTAGKALGDVIAAAQKAETQSTAALGRTPLLPAASADAGQIAAALQDGLGKSGLFYESHVADWAQGARTLGDLAAEPQARGTPAPTDPATAQFINLQLNAHEQGRVAWQGQLWPGQDLHWEVERDAHGNGQGGQDGGDAAPTWQSSLRLRFGALGEIAARVVLSGDQLHIQLDAASQEAGDAMQAARDRLSDALAAAGTPLSTLAIKAVPSAPPGEASDEQP